VLARALVLPSVAASLRLARLLHSSRALHRRSRCRALQRVAPADAIVARFGGIDVLVNTAFANTPKRQVLDMDADALEGWRRNVEIGGDGTLLACRHLAPCMVERGRGSIVNLTSMSSRVFAQVNNPSPTSWPSTASPDLSGTAGQAPGPRRRRLTGARRTFAAVP
jgi:NAD(P)-dependent dehydrogenase (short-subunit alcohol dehydrogenase family)